MGSACLKSVLLSLFSKLDKLQRIWHCISFLPLISVGYLLSKGISMCTGKLYTNQGICYIISAFCVPGISLNPNYALA
jgi:hypothetical protein